MAIDCVSGLDLDSGLFLGWPNTPFDNDFRRAALTVTFHRAKRGHFLAAGPIASGKLVVKGLGFKRSVAHYLPEIQTLGDRWSEFVILQPDDFIGNAEPNAPVSEFLLEDLTKGRIWRERPNKYHFGHAFILSGPSGQGGAARLSARGALRIGAGLVTVGCPPEAIPENAAQLNAIMLKPIGDAAALTEAMQDKRITALCLGPGMEVDWAAELLSVALASRGLHPLYLVLDADALTALSRDPALFAQLHENCVLTPHAGEFGRLFPDIAEKLAAPATVGPAYSKVDATREAAKRAGCVVLFKGPDTVIADPTGRCSINSAHYERSAPWLATAGSGDVLAGFITGLLARGFQPMQAAETAAWLHVECARSFGPGLIAEDLPEELPKVFRALGL